MKFKKDKKTYHVEVIDLKKGNVTVTGDTRNTSLVYSIATGELCRCTGGLKDCTGKEIYDKDVCLLADENKKKFTVSFEKGCFFAVFSKTDKQLLYLVLEDNEVEIV